MITKDTLPERVVGDMEAHAARAYPCEACGLLVKSGPAVQYLACKNTAANPDEYFEISTDEYAAAELLGEIVGVFHSHPDAVPDPSDWDMAVCQASRLPWLILSYPAGTWAELDPEFVLKSPLYERTFHHGTMDCFGFIQGWFFQELGVELETPVRVDEWWKQGKNLYLDNYASWGFERVTDGSLEQGDVILMQVHADVPNHGAVYLGDDLIGHHLYGRLSTKDVYGGYWRRNTTHVLRYKGQAHAA